MSGSEYKTNQCLCIQTAWSIKTPAISVGTRAGIKIVLVWKYLNYALNLSTIPYMVWVVQECLHGG